MKEQKLNEQTLEEANERSVVRAKHVDMGQSLPSPPYGVFMEAPGNPSYYVRMINELADAIQLVASPLVRYWVCRNSDSKYWKRCQKLVNTFRKSYPMRNTGHIQKSNAQI